MIGDRKERIEKLTIEILTNGSPLDPKTLIRKIMEKLANGDADIEEVGLVIESMQDRFIISETPRGLLILHNK